MIEAGLVPVPGPRRRLECRTAGRRRRADARRPGTRPYVSPNANSALHRVGIQANPVGMRLAELGFHDGPVRQAFERMRADHRGVRAGRRRHPALSLRADPHAPHGEEPPRIDGGLLLVRDVTELRKRDRLLLQQGRDDPRDPPPGEEQPADDLVAAAPAVAPADEPSRRRPRCRIRCGGSARSPSCTSRCRANRARTSRSSRSSGRCCGSPRRVCSHRTGRCGSRCRATAVGSRRTSPRRCRSC